MSKVFQVKPKRIKPPPLFIMEPRRCKKPTCASMCNPNDFLEILKCMLININETF